MIAAPDSDPRSGKLLTIEVDGRMRHLPRAALASLFCPGDLVIANDAATLPASLMGTHCPSGEPIEVRLAAWVNVRDPTRFTAIAFGAGDHNTRTEDRMPPPPLSPGDSLALGPLVALVAPPLDHSRLFRMRFLGDRAIILAGLARHGRPIQYAHVPRPLALWDVWTRIAADPIALEPPSAGFALDWRTQAVWRQRGIGFATLTHAAGISSTGDPTVDVLLPFDEPYRIPERTAAAIKQTKLKRGRIVAIGTTVVRALEAAANADGSLQVGDGIASGRITRETPLRVVDAILTGVHQPGDSHFELLRAFIDDAMLDQISTAFATHGYRAHEFGDSLLIERLPRFIAHLAGPHENQRRQYSDRPTPKIAALVADAFQEEEYFFPKVALNEAGYQVEVVSSRKEPVEIYSYFARTGLLDVDRAIADARPEDYVGVLVPGGAKSPALLAEDSRVTRFVQDVSARGGVIACVCRGSMLAARSKVVPAAA